MAAGTRTPLVEGAVVGHLQDGQRRLLVLPQLEILGESFQRHVLIGARHRNAGGIGPRIGDLYGQRVPHPHRAIGVLQIMMTEG